MDSPNDLGTDSVKRNLWWPQDRGAEATIPLLFLSDESLKTLSFLHDLETMSPKTTTHASAMGKATISNKTLVLGDFTPFFCGFLATPDDRARLRPRISLASIAHSMDRAIRKPAAAVPHGLEPLF